jgi:hypothetical protein
MMRSRGARGMNEPVNNTLFLVQVQQGVSDLLDDMSRQILAEVGESDDLMEELSAGGQLQNDVVVLLGFGKVDELNDVWVIQLSHDLYFL